MIMVAFRHVKQLSARHSHTPSLSGTPLNGEAKGRCQTVNYREVSKREGREFVAVREIFLPFIQDTRADIAKTLELSTHKTQQRGRNKWRRRQNRFRPAPRACHGATWALCSSRKRLRRKLEVLIGIGPLLTVARLVCHSCAPS